MTETTALKITWDDFIRQLSCHEYPSEQIALHGGIPPDTSYDYVSSSFLNGLINYIDNKRAFLINRYGITDDDNELVVVPGKTFQDQYEELARKVGTGHHPRFGTTDSDDALIFGETATDLWFFWYDCDCSDCSVIRISKESWPGLTLDMLIEFRLKHARDTYSYWQHTPEYPEPIIVEITNEHGDPPGGWWRG